MTFMVGSFMVLRNFLHERLLESSQEVGLTFEGKDWTFEDLDREAVFYGERLVSLDVRSGSRVALHIHNCAEAVFLFHALLYIGVEVVCVNTRLTKDEIAWQVAHADVQLLVTTDSDFLLDDVAVVSVNQLRMCSGIPFTPKALFQAEDVATIMFTSGTTGKPKAVLQTYGNHYFSAIYSNENLGLSRGDSWLCMMPLYHISGLSILFRSVVSGFRVLLHHKFSSDMANKAISCGEVTIASVVTNMLTRMLDDNIDYSNHFRGFLLGGGSAPLTLLKTCRERDISVYQTYGMTETCSQIVTLSAKDMLVKIGSAGKALGDCQVRIVDENNKVCAPYVSGEIVVKGAVVSPGYLHGEERLEQEWFHTGDIGYLDDDQMLYVKDRRSDLIISGGENVYPAEIEAVLLSHHAVLEAGVVGVNDEYWGSVPIAFVFCDPKVKVIPEELRALCEEKLAKYKVPKSFYMTGELPRNATGKLVRRDLQDMLKEMDKNMKP